MTNADQSSADIGLSAADGAEKAPPLKATAEQREILERINAQRNRLKARHAAIAQARAIQQAEPVEVRPDAPLMERLIAFARLHPIATAAFAGVALIVGPRKLMRAGGLALPLLSKWWALRGRND